MWTGPRLWLRPLAKHWNPPSTAEPYPPARSGRHDAPYVVTEQLVHLGPESTCEIRFVSAGGMVDMQAYGDI